uniref:Uncharacterized protein n=1 Tax=Meloidogyne enterolobii TaxID=390850 RepID=A0A6V7XGT2_MELEN|nr:unnamed protein product [Meloidogyne enterolobii]
MVVRRCVHAGVVYWLSCFWLVAMLQCWGSCTVAGGMLLLMILYKCFWLCFCWWFCFFSTGSLLDYFWWTWWWISLLFMEINRFCLGSWNWSNWWRNNQLNSQGYSSYKILSFFEHRCLFSLPILCIFLPMEIFQQLLNLWYCEGGVSSFTLSILNNSKSSSFMVLVKKQKSPQGWIETVPTAAATTEENGEEEEKVKRLEELTSSDKKIEQSIQISQTKPNFWLTVFRFTNSFKNKYNPTAKIILDPGQKASFL